MTGPSLVFLVFILIGADGGAPKADKDKIQGAWVLVSTESDGKTTPAESIKARNVRMIFEGDQIVAKMGDRTVSLGTFALDTNQIPKGYDRTYPDGSPRRGIYRLTDDTLTLSIAPLGKDRPKTFTTKPGDGITVLVYKREKP